MWNPICLQARACGAHPAGFALRGGQFRLECVPARHHQGLGPGLGAHGQRRPGAVLTANDAAQAEVDWAADAAPVLANPEAWLGQTATRQLMAGQALRQSMVKAPACSRPVPRCVCQPKARVML